MRSYYFVCLLLCIAVWPDQAAASYAPLTYRYDHFLYEIDPDDYPTWRSDQEVWLYHGEEVLPPAEVRVDGDALPALPSYLERSVRQSWDMGAVAATIVEQIASRLNREAGSVTISRGMDGVIAFDGVGLPGRKVDLEEAARMTIEALQQGITDITLPVIEVQPDITVQASDLVDQGIREVVTVGESDYRGSPAARQHNIAVGLEKFNGHLIPQGEEFSFNETLGPVNATTGYWKELVIKGDKTLPDYGGGLCQVSTTAYRGVWEYGFPISQRTNHSYSVQYYYPQGTDATIYPPYKDVKFVNDSPGSLLIQTHEEDGLAYFIYYGTKDERESQVLGPFIWGQTGVPPDKVEYTTDIPPGTTRKVGERVPGLKSAWYRVLTTADGREIEPYYSTYEARPRYTQVGVTPEELQQSEPEVTEDVVEDAPRTEEATDDSVLRRWTTRFRSRD